MNPATVSTVLALLAIAREAARIAGELSSGADLSPEDRARIDAEAAETDRQVREIVEAAKARQEKPTP